MKTRKQVVQIYRTLLDEARIKSQLEKIKQKVISRTMRKQGWEIAFSGKAAKPDSPEANGDMAVQINVHISKKQRREREGSDEVFQRNCMDIIDKLISTASQMDWKVNAGSNELAQKRMEEQQQNFDINLPTDIMPYFSHIYDRDYQIQILAAALNAARETDFRTRSHCLLWGKPACVSGEALIELNRAGKSFKLPLKNLHNRFNGLPDIHGLAVWDKSIPTKIRAREEDGTIRLHEIKFVSYSGLKETFLLELADGKSVRATNDHLILTDDGWKKLSDLRIGGLVHAEIKPAYSHARYKRNPYREWCGMIGHPYATRKKTGRYAVRVHRLAKEAQINNLSLESYVEKLRSGKDCGLQFLPPELVVHHEDGNVHNNDVSNLTIHNREVHSLLHTKQGAANNVLAKSKPQRIVSIKYHGFEPVYDIGLYGEPHNFLANGIVVHNCGKTEILLAFEKMVGADNVVKLDATMTTKAGAENLLLDLDSVPPIIILEEAEKCNPVNVAWMLGVLDERAEIIKTNARVGSLRKEARCLCLATVNNLAEFEGVMSGALASRFKHQIYCPRPSELVLRKILEREVVKVNGDYAWIGPIIRYITKVEKSSDPRRAIALLDGREKWITGEYEKALMGIRQQMKDDGVVD